MPVQLARSFVALVYSFIHRSPRPDQLDGPRWVWIGVLWTRDLPSARAAGSVTSTATDTGSSAYPAAAELEESTIQVAIAAAILFWFWMRTCTDKTRVKATLAAAGVGLILVLAFWVSPDETSPCPCARELSESEQQPWAAAICPARDSDQLLQLVSKRHAVGTRQ